MLGPVSRMNSERTFSVQDLDRECKETIVLPNVTDDDVLVVQLQRRAIFFWLYDNLLCGLVILGPDLSFMSINVPRHEASDVHLCVLFWLLPKNTDRLVPI